MALSSGADQNQTVNRALNRLHYGMTHDAADITTATTSDIVMMLDASDNYEPKYADATNVKELISLDGLNATASEINNAADVSARVQDATASGAITAGVQSVELNSVAAIAMTIASADAHQGLFIVKHTSSSGGQNHTLTLTSGTYDGTNTVALLNAANEALVVYFDSSGNGTIVENVGSVSLG